MKYWDSSALVPALIGEPRTPAVQRELDRDPAILVWWGTDVECVSALARLGREGRESRELVEAFARLATLAASWLEVEPTQQLRTVAKRLLRMHGLRAGDALVLAAAIVAADGNPESLPFVTVDERLARAADEEGFPVVEPN